METEIRELLNKLGTQIDGVESYLRRLHEIGERQEFHDDINLKLLGQTLRVRADLSLDTAIDQLRQDVLKIEKVLNGTFDH